MERKTNHNKTNRIGPDPADDALASNDDRDLATARAVFRDEIDSLRDVEARLGSSFHRAVEAILNCKGRLIISGVGKSGLIGQKIAATFTSTGTPSFYIHPVEAAHGDLGLVSRDDIVLFISKSGMSDEFGHLFPSFDRLGVTLIALTGNTRSYLAKQSDIVLDTAVRQEACALDLAPTTSTTVALVMGDALACALMKRRGFNVTDFARNHPSGLLGKRLTLRVQELMRTGDAMPLVPVDTVLKDALIEMATKAIGCVGVTEKDGRLCGIITDGDLKRIMVRTPDAIETSVEDLMTRNPKTINASVLAAEALASMEMNPSGPLTMYFIVDDQGRPNGVLHIHDILRSGLGGD
ncbi:MAG: KpsF/GutQ family sugar-phosphate isomerase [bacterium]|nr:KpsF/GutQ family sugar-phosphate isomerase [bacterium]